MICARCGQPWEPLAQHECERKYLSDEQEADVGMSDFISELITERDTYRDGLAAIVQLPDEHAGTAPMLASAVLLGTFDPSPA